jgi:hypothetical protein
MPLAVHNSSFLEDVASVTSPLSNYFQRNYLNLNVSKVSIVNFEMHNNLSSEINL